MDRIGFGELVRSRRDWDRNVELTEGVDHWSSGSDWAFAAHHTWGTGPEVVLRSDAGWAAFGRLSMDGADALIGLDPVWAFASPFVGPEPERLTDHTADLLAGEPGWDLVFLTGLIAESRLDLACIRAFGRRHQLYAGPSAVRLVADVSDIEHWWSERGEKFRRNIRRARRHAADVGLSIEVLDDWEPSVLMARLLAVEASSWKGRDESGLLGGDMAAFYTVMAGPLQAEGRLRAAVALLDGRDVGFILGAVRSSTYRGLQVSYVVGCEALSVGHLLQDHEIRRVAGTGVCRYDLGMDMEYKHRWATAVEETRTIIVRR